MTPCTSDKGVPLVAGAANGGFHAELAGGGLSRKKMFRERIEELTRALRPGVGITLNLLYLNAKQWAFQFPMALQMRRQGFPIESITVAAGVPTPEKADEIIGAMLSAGMRFISFKPGSLAAINAVVEIARRHPTMVVVVQWTGGRAGGHHSFEDVHQVCTARRTQAALPAAGRPA